MSLYETFYETAVLMDRKTTASPVGGFISGWTEGAEFQAAFTGLTPTEKDKLHSRRRCSTPIPSSRR